MLAGQGAEKPLGAVLDATVSGQREDGLTALLFDGGRLLVAEGGRKGKARASAHRRRRDSDRARKRPWPSAPTTSCP